MIEFHIPGTPVAQSRPRFTRRDNFVATYDAAPAKDYKSWVRMCATTYMKEQGIKMIPRDVPLALTVVIDLQKPKSAPKTREIYPTKKPDCDNVLKGIQDAMESICYEADQQIVDVRVIKRYTTSEPGVHIRLWESKQ